MVSSTATTIPGQDLSSLIKGRYVTYTGRLGSMSHDDFVEIVEAHGGRYALSGKFGRAVALLVIGAEEWPLTPSGTLVTSLRHARILKRKEGVRTKVLSEEQFLAGLG